MRAFAIPDDREPLALVSLTSSSTIPGERRLASLSSAVAKPDPRSAGATQSWSR
jgi:hypothetical protein